MYFFMLAWCCCPSAVGCYLLCPCFLLYGRNWL